jgi:hypothetical protein
MSMERAGVGLIGCILLPFAVVFAVGLFVDLVGTVINAIAR